MENIMEVYVKQLREHLENHERTPAWLSRKLGVSATLVYLWLKGERRISQEWYNKISDVFDK